MSVSHVALLRGVNLGPKRKISMPQLRATVEELGFAGVRTYINSGNVVLTSDRPAEEIESRIAEAIEATFSHRVDVVVRSAAQLDQVLAANPFPDGNPSQVTVAFLAGAPGPEADQRLAAVAVAGEPYVMGDREIYVNYTHGIGESRLTAGFSAAIGVSATVRNLRTVTRLRDLCAD